ncbi:MAG: DUF4838 domain-containing protein [Lachnospiraceae bacterium]|nr:DUF4838 domain-containing protein [Lachnospiraceae bacterium]
MNILLYYDHENQTIAYAAQELLEHLELLSLPATTASLSYTLSVDPGMDDSMEHYHIRSSKPDITITASNARGVLLAVYAYLRRLGFRFLMPGKDGTYVPEAMDSDTLYQNFEYQEEFRHRGVCIEGANSLENILEFIEWLPKLGYNAFFIQFAEPYVFLQRWYSHVNNPEYHEAEPDDSFYASCYTAIREAISLRGLNCHAAGHGFTAQALGYPSIGWVTAAKPLADDKSELAAMVNGKRELSRGIPSNTNLCYSNPQALDCFCDAVLKYIQEHPDTDYLHVWLADELNRICECEDCVKSTPSDQYIHLMNLLDERLSEHNIDCKIVFLLYLELLYPPKTERLKNPDRFVMMFAPISRTFQESYPTHPKIMPPKPCVRNRMTLPVDINENLSFLEGWQQCFDGDSFVYDYPLGKAHYGDFGYMSISRVLYGDIQRLHDLNLNGYMSCQELRAAFPNTFPNYVMGLTLEDSSRSLSQMTEEYYSAAYGEQYRTALYYLETVSSLSSTDYFIGKGPRISPEASASYQELLDFLIKEQPLLHRTYEEAQKATGLNAGLQKQFWAILDYHVNCCIPLTKAVMYLSANDNENAAKYDREFLQCIRSHEPEFQPYLDVYRLIEVSANYTGFKKLR